MTTKNKHGRVGCKRRTAWQEQNHRNKVRAHMSGVVVGAFLAHQQELTALNHMKGQSRLKDIKSIIDARIEAIS